MKKGPRNFLGRKSQSLFDTNIKIKDMDNMELVLGSPVIPDSGTASVRARPTVKHHPSSDSFQGFAVPTPKVPLLPPVNGPKVNGSVGVNGSVLSVPDLVEGEIFVPPPPSMAPPPPPAIVIPPPLDFMGDLNAGPDLGTLQPPSMPAPKLISQSIEEDLASLKPPTMAPPKPPSTPPANIPEHPRFAPPQPPIEKQQKTHKNPPPKPIRLSSIPTLDSPPHTPAPPPPVQTPTLSSFNPQNQAKLYSAPKASVLNVYEDRDTRPKQMLFLEDSGSVNTPPVLVQVDGKVPKVAAPSNPIPQDVPELKEIVQITEPSQPPLPDPKKEATPVTISAQPEIAKPLQIPPQISTQTEKVSGTQLNLEPNKDKFEGSPSQSRKFSPLIDRKLRNLKSSDTNGPREGHAASPLALLMAAKERDKQKSTQETKKNEQQSASIHPSDSSPNSFVVIPKSSSSSSLRPQESQMSVPPVEHTQQIQTPPIGNQVTSNTPALSLITAAASPTATNTVEQKQNAEQSPSKSQSTQPSNNTHGISMPLLPPPPEFDDLDDFMEPPPSIRPPDPPVKKATPTPAVSLSPLAPVSKPPVSLPPPSPVSIPPASLSPPAPVPKPPVCLPPPPPAPVPPPTFTPPPPPPPAPSPPSKPKPSASPKLQPPESDVKPKPQVQTKTQGASTQLPSTLSPSQATLLSILQKKMLEMDHKMGPVKEAEPSSDDWNGPLSDEEKNVPTVPKAAPQSKNSPVVNKAATLDMRELEGKMKKNQQTSSVKTPTSNGPSKHAYGMTFTVRPGTKQPITLANKGES
ncbi:extensin isoform X2 [Anabas testudineus]|uniref:extensin isoform X2 n=1 Tax=Anabas testudineus TaxID=64144 RepID=UPI000E458F8C|nr:extensin isoform X2 [Anabas testudineus]